MASNEIVEQKVRKPNWSSAEVSRFLEAACQCRKAVCTTDKSCTSQKQKVAAYKIMTDKVNEVTRVEYNGEVERVWTEIRERWMREKHIAICKHDEDLRKDGLPPASGIDRLSKSHLQETACTALVLDILSGKAVLGVTDFSVDMREWRKNVVSKSKHNVRREDHDPSNDGQPALDIDSSFVTELPLPLPDTSECDIIINDAHEAQSPELDANCADRENSSEKVMSNTGDSVRGKRDSEECLKDRRKQRKKQKKRFSDLEMTTLLTEVNRHRDILLDKIRLRDTATIRRRDKTWSLIQRQVQSVSAQAPGIRRTAAQLRLKWRDMKQLALKTPQQNGAKFGVSLFPYTSQVVAILNGTFQEEKVKNSGITLDASEDIGQSNQAEQSDSDCQPPHRHNICEVSRTDTEGDNLILYSDCDESDSEESLQARTKQKKKQAKRFSDLEMTTLMTEVNRHRDILLDKVRLRDTATIQQQDKSWSLIERKVQSVSAQAPGMRRTAAQLRLKWRDMKKLALQTSQQNRAKSGVFPYTSQVVAILNGTFQEDGMENSGSADIPLDASDDISLSDHCLQSDKDCQPPQRHNSCEVSLLDAERESLYLEMDCDESDSEESLQARTKQKKKRKQNFSDLEMTTLLTEVNRHRDVLLNKAKNMAIIRRKDRSWSLVLRKVHTVSTVPGMRRTGEELRKKWRDMKKLAFQTPQQSGDESDVSVFPYASQVVAILNGTFHDEHNCCEVSQTDAEQDGLILEMTCDESDSEQSLQARQKQKKNRKQNFSDLEMTTLLTEVNRHRDLVMSKRKDLATIQRTNRSWSLILRKVQSVRTLPGMKRTGEELRTKWRDMKRQALQHLQQNGDESGVSVFPYTSQVVAILNGTLQDEPNSCEVSQTDTEQDNLKQDNLILEMTCDESDSEESLQARPKKKRKRKQNFSDLETTTLLTEVNRHRDALMSKGYDQATIRQKDKSWSLILSKVQSVRTVPGMKRTGEELRKKWRDMRRQAQQHPQQNEDTSGVSVFPYTSQVVAILNGTFQDKPNSCEVSQIDTERDNLIPYLDCEESDSEESLQATPKQKRKRKKNFSHLEMTTLLTEVHRHRDVLLSKGYDQATIRQKDQNWSLILRKMHSVRTVPGMKRTGEELRTKWRDIKRQALQHLQQNGDESGVSAFPYTSQVVAILNGTFQDEQIRHSSSTDIAAGGSDYISLSNQEQQSDRDCQPTQRHNSCEASLTHRERDTLILEMDKFKEWLLEAESVGHSQSQRQDLQERWRMITEKVNKIFGIQDQHPAVNHLGGKVCSCSMLEQQTGGVASGQLGLLLDHGAVKGKSGWTHHSMDLESDHVAKSEPGSAAPETLVIDQMMACAGLGGRTEGGRVVKMEVGAADSIEGGETQHRETQHSTASTVLQQQLDSLVNTCGKLRALGVEAGVVVLGDGRMVSCGSERLRHLLSRPCPVASPTENTSSASEEPRATAGDWKAVTLDTVLSASPQTCVVDNSGHTLPSNDVNYDADGREDDSVHTDQWGSPGPDDDDDVSGDERMEESGVGTELPPPPLTSPVSGHSQHGQRTPPASRTVRGKREDSMQGSPRVLHVTSNEGSSEVTEVAVTADTGTEKVKDTDTDSAKVKDIAGGEDKDPTGSARKTPRQSSQHKSPKKTRIYKCKHCGKILGSKHSLQKHEETHNSERPFPCDVCHKSFRRLFHLLAHKERHLGLHKVQCEVCGKKITRENIGPHMRVHTGEKPYKCDFCGRDFAFLNGFKRHRLQHTGEFPYMCDICGEAFRSGPSMRCHRKKHTGEKPYVCDVCGEAFRYKEPLTIHSRKHTGIQPHTCDICGKFFTCTNHLTVHRRLHTGEKPYSCQVCGERFHRSDVLLLHKRKHDAGTV